MKGQASGARLQREALTIYDDPNERYVVTLIVSYDEDDLARDEGVSGLDMAVANEPDKMKAAAAAALDLTRDGGSGDTQWYVYDRKTGKGQFFEQSEFEHLGVTPVA